MTSSPLRPRAIPSRVPSAARNSCRPVVTGSRRGRTVLASVGLVAVLGLTACGAGGGNDDAASSGASGSGTAGAQQDRPNPDATPTVKVAPAADAGMVNPADPVVVSTDAGELADVSVTATGSGTRAEGALNEDRTEWRSSAPLEFGETYTVAYTARNGSHTTADRTAFSTVDAAHEADVSFDVKDGQTYGVWQVVELTFSEPVTEKDAVEKAVTVDGAHEKGRFRWYSDRKLRFRPEKPWAPNSTVKVSANILGTDLGNGMIGNGNKTVSFKTGAEQRAYVDNDTKTLVAYVNGKKTGSWPVTLGNPEWPSTTGKKVILEQAASYEFKASSLHLEPGDPHYYPPFDATNVSRLTWSGEFIHQALPSAWPLLGVANVSHGCVGMPPEGAAYIFKTFRPGDMVEVVNTDYPQANPDDGYGDWNIPFEHYSDEDWHGNW
ncbi:L,D-transpeptidase [Kocuria tytonis]|uniref:L,D-transpeptidase n=1 Tax=Kocuria tytonis TaxID=2054280 RepID=A0A495A3I3_9MICC|nr:Ig-like domain-containing protein [Kocuria tytonis]RKQ34150.1 L,D-transpeptidase [Kocuria tytonis]